MLSSEYILSELDRFLEIIRKYEAEFRKQDRYPKNHDLRPYRWCSRDIVFALLAVKHERYGNYLLADLCLMANPPQYYENSGARVAMGFLLSEAYKCGTTMEIVFGKNVEPRIENGVTKPRVPVYICDLAIELGVKLKYVDEAHITPFESRQIYMGLAGFSKAAQEKIMKLAVNGELSPERACYLVMGGLWSLPEAETLILSSSNPESVLLSDADPAERHLYLNDLIAARGAILGGALDRRLLRKELLENGQIVESEDEETILHIDFDSEFYAKLYRFGESVEIPWTGGGVKRILNPEDRLLVLVRPRTSSEIVVCFENDVESLTKLVLKKTGLVTSYIGLLYPRDWEEIPSETRSAMTAKVEQAGAILMLSPESVAGLDKEAMRRLATGKMVRHE